MTPAEFKKKWARYSGKETAAYQEHFNDLCAMLGQPTPVSADPTGSETFCFQKRVLKDAELFMIGEDGAEAVERGFADVWKKDCFAWEYKGKKKNLDAAYRQLLRYRESLENPPLLVVCDFDRFIIRTNFNGTVQQTYEFTNALLDKPESLRYLRHLFTNPEALRPLTTTSQVTEELAEKIAAIARSLREREAIELADARTRAAVNVAQKQNLRVARFLNRIVFCLFAEDTGLLPEDTFKEICQAGLNDPHLFAESLEDLFKVMAKGGRFGAKIIRHFNGHLFDEATVFDLTADEIGQLADAADADWQYIQPSIMGTLFERALDAEGRLRAQLGAHYTSETDIKTIVEPVLMAPLRREWAALKRDLLPAFAKGKGKPEDRQRLAKFLKKLSTITVLDPACGSGNFLYVALQLLLHLEKEVITFAAQLGFEFRPQVGVHQLKAIEINPYAFELAQVAVQIGYLQWLRDNGFPLDRSPVLQTLDGFENKDALLNQTFRAKPKSLKAARAAEHTADDTIKVYTERAWPDCDIIVSNPPFLGGKLLRRELNNEYVDEMFRAYGDRVPPEADLCCYWFEKARQQIEDGKCRRAGLLATQGIRGGANREVLKRIKSTGDIFFAESDRPWILDGANVHVSMVGFDKGEEKERVLNGKPVATINANLTTNADLTQVATLVANLNIAFMGTTKGGPFDIAEPKALEFLRAPSPHGKPNSDVIVPWVNGMDLTQRLSRTWIIDFGAGTSEQDAAKYEAAFEFVKTIVKPERETNARETYRRLWWQHVEARPAMRAVLAPLPRFLCTTRVSKYRLFVWLQAPTLPDSATFAFARSDDYFFGVLHSRFHEVWALKLGTRLETRPRYTPTTCFETFPFPIIKPPKPPPAPKPPKLPEPRDPSEANIISIDGWLIAKEKGAVYGSPHEQIEEAARELNELRERWLNPPEWTREEVLEFPASSDGPWARYVKKGVARYPRLVPKDADCAAKLKKRTLTKLYNERPTWLDFAHKKLDAAVATAYGWPADLSDDDILARLLELNRARAKTEPLTRQKKTVAPREKRDDEML
jgi:type II restriction/modification system DNA methylase subunit YeeA